MLADHERAAFDEIVARLGPLRESGRPYRMSWWLPPSALVVLGVLMMVTAVTTSVEGLLVFGGVAVSLGTHWALRRRRRCPAVAAQLRRLRTSAD